jgi:non-ribosomal peptide synthetase-like protein
MTLLLEITRDHPEHAVAQEPRLIHEYFERQADLRPNHLALECEDRTLTYKELERFSNKIARFLRARDVGPGSLIGIYLNKSSNLFAAILGVLKAGAGYVPIDPQIPVERLSQIVSDANLSIVLTNDALAEPIRSLISCSLVALDLQRFEIESFSSARLISQAAGHADICYVIYTSGSTGRPKGVALEHRNVVNFIGALRTEYRLNCGDRVYQGFSVAFDASVEEIWAAFSLGGTLVVPSDDVTRSPDQVAHFINSKRVTYFSTVPSFLALITDDLPAVRLLIVGGEACSSALVNKWATPSRRMLNTYGPTETAVVATLADCVAGETVTIGSPLPGYICHVADENLQEVRTGEIGELYIGGRSVARGYMNLPEITARQFVENPFSSTAATAPRLYRTRDLVRTRSDGAFEFVGRSDDQVKIRGYRIELSEIESVLQEHPSIRAAAVLVHEREGFKEIAAYIVPGGNFGELQMRSVAKLLSSRLPEYMQPKYLELVESLPRTTSGKIDRKALPAPTTAFLIQERPFSAPESDLEAKIADVWKTQLNIGQVSVDDDFFRDLKGNSLLAAHVVTELRTRLGTLNISVKDIYEYRTVKKIASHLCELGFAYDEQSEDISTKTENTPETHIHVGVFTRWLCVFLQTFSLAIYYAVLSAPLVCFILICARFYSGKMDSVTAGSLSTLLGFATWPAWLFISIAVKWLTVGRYKAGRYPVWGLYYFRWWLATRFQSLGWPDMLVGTPLMNIFYRAMGARVGKNCVIGTPLCGAFDLVSIGDNSSVGRDAQLLGYRVENGWLMLGTVDIGAECFVGMHTAIGLNIVMEDRSCIDDDSLLPDGTILLRGEQRTGSPPKITDVLLPEGNAERPSRLRAFLFGLAHLGLIYLMGYFLIASILPSIVLVWYVLQRWGAAPAIVSVYIAAPLAVIWYAVLAILVRRLIIGRVKPGVFPVASRRYLQYWFLDYLMRNTRQLLLPLYATLFLPTFLRLMGARIGKHVEISTITNVIPDLLEIDDGCFLADGCIIGGNRIYRGIVEVRSNRVGRRTFIGNSALVPGGANIGSDSLIGVMSKPPTAYAEIPDGTRWLGSPSFEVPRAKETSCFLESQTYRPKLSARCCRTFLDTLRIVLPSMFVATDMLTFSAVVIACDYFLPLWSVLLVAPLLALYLSLTTIVWVARIKSLLIGEFKPTVKPLWCSFVWLNEVVNGIYETAAATALTPLMGTPYISIYLRKLGCHIGRWVFLETTLFSEFDLVEIGDYAALNMGCTVQTHLFEDRVMKSDRLRIGAGCTVGNMAVVLYGTEMQSGSTLAPLSVLMKGEVLPPNTRWRGIPSEPDSEPQTGAAAL